LPIAVKGGDKTMLAVFTKHFSSELKHNFYIAHWPQVGYTMLGIAKDCCIGPVAAQIQRYNDI
tara:strand:+ start:435 stop:623 length:189 start_codon:yes stop_codon:yes gene_type:complete